MLLFVTDFFMLCCMHPDVAKLVEAGRIPQAVGERLSEIAPENFCSHKTWGAGKVESWDLPAGKVVINFEKQPHQEMALQFALQKTEPLDPEHFSARKLENIGELRKLVTDDPESSLSGRLRVMEDL